MKVLLSFHVCSSYHHPVAGLQNEIGYMLKPKQLTNKWAPDAPQTVQRTSLLTKIFSSSGISTKFLDNTHDRRYHELTENKYKLPSTFCFNIVIFFRPLNFLANSQCIDSILHVSPACSLNLWEVWLWVWTWSVN